MPIVHFLEENAIEYPNETAVVERIYDNGNIIRSEITWEEMNCRANRFANALQSKGVKRQDTANAFEEDIQKSLSIGMNAHVAKPIKENVLLETMKNLL